MPYRCRTVEDLLTGQVPDPGVLREAARVLRDIVTPAADLHATADYRRHVAGVLLRRAVTDAYDRAVAATASTSAA